MMGRPRKYAFPPKSSAASAASDRKTHGACELHCKKDAH